jgi:hypothetical protein
MASAKLKKETLMLFRLYQLFKYLRFLAEALITLLFIALMLWLMLTSK